MNSLNVNNVRRMTNNARRVTRQNLRFSKLRGMQTGRIIKLIVLLGLPSGAQAIPWLSFLPSAAVTYLSQAVAVQVSKSALTSFLANENVRVYSAIIAGIAILYFMQKIYSSRTNRLRIQLERNRMRHNAEQREKNREAQNRLMKHQMNMMAMMMQSQTQVVSSAIREAIQTTHGMATALTRGEDPRVPVPLIRLPSISQ